MTKAATVKPISPHLSNIECPNALRNLRGWLIWRLEHHDAEAKPRKVPYYVNGRRRHGVQGRPEDREQLTTFDAARAAAARLGFDGVGLALMPEFGIVAGDFDNCITNGKLHRDVESIITGTYAEYSPSGNGVRAFWTGDLGNSKSKSSDEQFGFETFSSKGFVTYTGNRLDITDLLGSENTVAQAPDALRDLCVKRFGKVDQVSNWLDDPLMEYEPPVGMSETQIRECLDVLPKELSYDEWLAVGMAIHHETGGEGFELWDEWSATSSKYSTREYGLARWNSFGKGGHRPVTIRSLIKFARQHGAYINMEVASASEFDAVADDQIEPEKLRFQVIPAVEFATGKHPSWIVKGIIPKAEIVTLYGESGSGKTFAVTDLAMAIARGLGDWRGNRVKQGRVVYIAAEGGGGFRKRLTAYAIHHGVDLAEIPFGVIHAAPNFLQKADALDVARAIVATGGADVIVVDTFAQVTPGANENAAEDMGKALSHCKGLHRATGGTIILVHHSGKDASKGSRGWSGIKAAVDAEIEVLRTPGGRMLRVGKQKDGEDGLELGFELQVVPVGMDEDGDVIDSCVVIDAPLPVIGKGGKRKQIGPVEKLVIEVVGEIAMSQTAGIEIEHIVELVKLKMDPPEPGPNGKARDTRPQRIKRAISSLCQGDDAPYLLEDDCISVL